MALLTQVKQLRNTTNITQLLMSTKLLISVATETRDIINTTIPVLPNDISVIIDILDAILNTIYMYVCL